MEKLTLNKQNQKDLTDYCKLNNIEDVDKFFQKCFKRGYDIERYGLIGDKTEKIIEYVEKEIPIEVIKYVEKETIKEVPIEVIKEVEKIVEVIKEVPIEQKIFSTNEVIVEKIVEVPVEVEIAFHDLVEKQPLPTNQVYHLWKRIKVGADVQEFVADPNQCGFGIGLLRVPE